jgi:hypothetical protein
VLSSLGGAVEQKKGHGIAVAPSQSGSFLLLYGRKCQALSWWRGGTEWGWVVRVGGGLPPGLKPRFICSRYAALKRRSSTVVRGLRHG